MDGIQYTTIHMVVLGRSEGLVWYALVPLYFQAWS